MSVIRSIGSGIQTPAINVSIAQLVSEAHLMRYNGIKSTMQSIVQFAAPAAAGIIFSVSTLQMTLMVDILTAAIGIGLLSSMYAGFMPLGMAIFGPLADVIPLQWIMIGSGAALIGLAIVLCCGFYRFHMLTDL